jgi:GNAT superfamily N-acetyltransferase
MMENNQELPSNFERLIALADVVFDVKNDPGQLDVDQNVLARLEEIHPDCVSEYADENGPAAWILMIPCTEKVMEDFLADRISEKQLFEASLPGQEFEAIYLCSALVLEEYRRKGIARQLSLQAIDNIRKEFPIKTLFVWAFSGEGLACARRLSQESSLPLRMKAETG